MPKTLLGRTQISNQSVEATLWKQPWKWKEKPSFIKDLLPNPTDVIYFLAPGPALQTAVPKLFGTTDWFRGRQFFHGLGRGMVSR